VVGYQFPDRKVTYNRRDTILYALGLGETDLRFVYELNQNFAALPTYPVVLSFKGESFDVVPFGAGQLVPGFEIDPTQILHGEQSLEILQQIPPEGEFVLKSKVKGLYDKGKGAVMVTESVLVSDKVEYARLVSSTFIRGAGGFGGDRGPSGGGNEPPKRAPDSTFVQHVRPDQALLYRLSGDYNPLHADPEMASMVGFEKPILHGLGTYGIAARAILKTYCNNDPSLFRSISARFSAPVIPGETLLVEMWKEGNKVIYQVKVKERNVIAISNAAATLNEKQGASTSDAEEPAFKCAAVFEAMKQSVENQPELVKKINFVYVFHISNGKDTISYLVDLKKGVFASPVPANVKADCEITASDDNYFDVAIGKLNPQAAFIQGKLKIKGNILAAQKLALIQQAASKL